MAPKTKAPAKPVQNYHFFGSNALHWALGDTREEVLARLAQQADAQWIKNCIASDDGLYVWTLRVETPRNVKYSLESFAPIGVPISTPREYKLLSKKHWAEVVPDTIPAEQLQTNKSRYGRE